MTEDPQVQYSRQQEHETMRIAEMEKTKRQKEQNTHNEDMLLGGLIALALSCILAMFGMIFYVHHINNEQGYVEIQACEEIESGAERRKCLVGI